MNKSTLRWPAALLALATTAVHIEGAQAQRERPSRTDRREERQQGTENMTPDQRRQFFQQRMQERMKNMTPEQRQRMQERMQQWQQNGGGFGGGNGGGFGGGFGGGPGGGAFGGMAREERQRQAMIRAGITDEAIQDAIVLFLTNQTKARGPLLEMAQKMARDLANPQVTPEQTTTTLTAFRAAVEQDKTRNDAALQELDAKIKYSTTPKLETFLTLIGILGAEAPTVGGSSAIFAPAGGGPRGFGNGGGAPQGQAPPVQ